MNMLLLVYGTKNAHTHIISSPNLFAQWYVYLLRLMTIQHLFDVEVSTDMPLSHIHWSFDQPLLSVAGLAIAIHDFYQYRDPKE